MNSNTAIDTRSSVHLEADENQYLSFTLAGEQYGVDILKVQEIRGQGMVTVIPNTPSFVKGVINLRGSIVPIIDLRARLNIQGESGADEVVIIMTIARNGRSQMVGFVVDAVSDVLNIPDEDVRPAPQLSTSESREFLSGIAQHNGKLVLIMDTDLMFADSELEEMRQ